MYVKEQLINLLRKNKLRPSDLIDVEDSSGMNIVINPFKEKVPSGLTAGVGYPVLALKIENAHGTEREYYVIEVEIVDDHELKTTVRVRLVESLLTEIHSEAFEAREDKTSEAFFSMEALRLSLSQKYTRESAKAYTDLNERFMRYQQREEFKPGDTVAYADKLGIDSTRSPTFDFAQVVCYLPEKVQETSEGFVDIRVAFLDSDGDFRVMRIDSGRLKRVPPGEIETSCNPYHK